MGNATETMKQILAALVPVCAGKSQINAAVAAACFAGHVRNGAWSGASCSSREAQRKAVERAAVAWANWNADNWGDMTDLEWEAEVLSFQEACFTDLRRSGLKGFV